MVIIGKWSDYGKRVALELGLIFIIAAVSGSLLLWMAGDIRSKAFAIREQKRQLTVRSLSLQSLADLKSDAERARTFSSLLENILPLKDQLINFPKDMEDIAGRYGVDFGSTFGEERAASGVEPGFIAFTFNIGGAYDRIVAFINEAERSRYIIEWMAFDLSERSGSYRGTVSGKVFSRT